MTTKTFRDFDLDPRLCDALAEDGITEPFPIQELTLPVAIDGHDVIGQARTGSGKTFGFGLPALHRVDESRKQVQVLVVTPTRELCLQVTDDFQQASRKTDIQLLAIYGGVPIEPQTEALRAGVHVVVGTPGRLLDHVRRGNLDLSTCKTLILDEADEMLDMGFLPDVEQLIAKCNEDRHTMLFSATMPTAVVNLARRYMDRPTFIRAEVEQHTVPDRMEQHFFLVHKLDKPRILARILQTPERGLAVVFTRTKAMADRLVDDLRGYDIDAVAIHGDLRQATREKNLDKFKSGAHRHDVLVATEVAARGLDIDELTHVVNYDPPEDEKMYLHRIGRTARAGQKGVAITFATFAEVDRVNAIRKTLDLASEPIEEVFSTSARLQELFELPSETPWDHLGTTRGARSSRSKDTGGAKASSGSGGSERSGRSSGSSSPRGRSASEEGSGRKRGDRDRPADEAKQEQTRAPSRVTSRDDDATEGIDGSTATRARTRTRSRGAASDAGSPTTSSRSGSSKRDDAKDGGAKDDGAKNGGAKNGGAKNGGAKNGDAKDGDAKGSGRTRARARRDRSSEGGSSGNGASSRSSSKGSSDERTPSTRDRSSASGSSKGGGRSSGGGRSRGGSGGRPGTDRSNRSGGNRRGGGPQERVLADPASVPTEPGDDARGDGDPGIVRQVKVEHLP